MLKRLLWLSVGTFVIGTEGFVIAGVLPEMAADLNISVALCGQLVTAFALAYAIGSPVLSTLLGAADRKLVLVSAIVVFAIANILAALASSFGLLLAARILLALSAGVFVPNANAVAVSLVPPEMRGRAIATVIGGMTVAVALGAPLGTLLAQHATWRATFGLIGVVSFAAALGLVIGLPRNLPRAAASLAERVALAADPKMLNALLVTVFWSMAAFTVFTYLAAFLGVIGVSGSGISGALFVFGVAAAIGNIAGGWIVDRIGPARTLVATLCVLVVVLAATSIAAKLLPGAFATVAVLALILPWGIAGWAFYPAQSTRLIQIAPSAPVVALSLNSSALYFGTASGAGIGALVMTYGSPTDLGLVAALCTLIGLGLLGLSLRNGRPAIVAAPAE